MYLSAAVDEFDRSFQLYNDWEKKGVQEVPRINREITESDFDRFL